MPAGGAFDPPMLGRVVDSRGRGVAGASVQGQVRLTPTHMLSSNCCFDFEKFYVPSRFGTKQYSDKCFKH